MTAFSIAPVTIEPDLEAVRSLCWMYRDFLLNHTEIDRGITETFYPTAKYESLMSGLAVEHARPNGIILLARDEAGALLGCGMSHALDAQTSEIKRVFVTEAARGRGLAKALCQNLIDQAQQDGFSRMVLDTSRNLIPAQKLYHGLGFNECAPYQAIPSHALSHLIFFEKTL